MESELDDPVKKTLAHQVGGINGDLRKYNFVIAQITLFFSYN